MILPKLPSYVKTYCCTSQPLHTDGRSVAILENYKQKNNTNWWKKTTKPNTTKKAHEYSGSLYMSAHTQLTTSCKSLSSHSGT